MSILNRTIVFIVNYKYILLPIVFTTFLLHLFLSKPRLGLYSASISNREPLLRTYYGLEKFKEPGHLDPIEISSLFPGHDFKSINDVHSEGLMHLGNILIVTDVDDMVLIVRRHPEMVTCPSAWSVVGEHFAFDEKVADAANRAVIEELGPSVAGEVTSVEDIFHPPLFYTKDYLNSNGKKDRQITYVVHVKLGKKHSSIKIKPAKEIIDYKWITIDEFLKWIRDDMIKQEEFDFCDNEYRQLLLKSLTELRKGETDPLIPK